MRISDKRLDKLGIYVCMLESKNKNTTICISTITKHPNGYTFEFVDNKLNSYKKRMFKDTAIRYIKQFEADKKLNKDIEQTIINSKEMKFF